MVNVGVAAFLALLGVHGLRIVFIIAPLQAVGYALRAVVQSESPLYPNQGSLQAAAIAFAALSAVTALLPMFVVTHRHRVFCDLPQSLRLPRGKKQSAA